MKKQTAITMGLVITSSLLLSGCQSDISLKRSHFIKNNSLIRAK